MEKIIGLIDAPFTPFYENGEVNYEPIEAYAKMLQKNGLRACSSTVLPERVICSLKKSA